MFERYFHHHSMRFCLAVSLVSMLTEVVCSGCGRDRAPERVVVSGRVTYQGAPVAKGRIRFVPSKGTAGPVSIAKVVDGAYRVEAKGGVPVATQRVEIFAYRRDSAGHDQNGDVPVGIRGSEGFQYLPTKYNDSSELELIVEAVRGEIHKDFELTK